MQHAFMFNRRLVFKNKGDNLYADLTSFQLVKWQNYSHLTRKLAYNSHKAAVTWLSQFRLQ